MGVFTEDFSIGLGVLGCDDGLAVGSLVCSLEDFGNGSIVLSFRSGVAIKGTAFFPPVMRSMVLLSEGRMSASSKARSSGPLPLLRCLEPKSTAPEVMEVFRLPVGLRFRVERVVVCSGRILSESEEPESEII